MTRQDMRKKLEGFAKHFNWTEAEYEKAIDNNMTECNLTAEELEERNM